MSTALSTSRRSARIVGLSRSGKIAAGAALAAGGAAAAYRNRKEIKAAFRRAAPRARAGVRAAGRAVRRTAGTLGYGALGIGGPLYAEGQAARKEQRKRWYQTAQASPRNARRAVGYALAAAPASIAGGALGGGLAFGLSGGNRAAAQWGALLGSSLGAGAVTRRYQRGRTAVSSKKSGTGAAAAG